MYSKAKRLLASLAVGLGMTLGLVGLLSNSAERSVARAGDLQVCVSGCTYDSIQAAVDDANDGGVIKVAAGTYTGVQARTGITQVVYISKTVTVRGGYTITNWTVPNPEANPTTLDAQGQGRVLYITGDVSPTIEGLRITGGEAAGLGGDPSAEDAGGGVYVITATVAMSDNQVFNNLAQAGGGAYFLKSADVMLTHNTIINNQGLNRAGGIYFRNSPGATLTANTISNNVADHQGFGQKHHGGAYFLFSDNATLINNIISGNRAANLCGGVCFNRSANAMLTGNTVTSNSAGSPGFGNGEGGGLNFGDSTGAILISNRIADNSAVTFGGGMYQERSDTTFVNNVITDNYADIVGSGLYIAGSSPRLLHSTIARNGDGDGSGVHVTDIFGSFSTVALTNTILVSHTAGITVTAGNTATLNGVLWYSNTANIGGMGTITVTNEYTGDPAFAIDGYHLRHGSAAIDKVDDGVTTDIDGEPRPMRARYDIGADEVCYVGIKHIQIVADLWHQPAGFPYDCDGDGIITIKDIMCWVTLLGELCP